MSKAKINRVVELATENRVMPTVGQLKYFLDQLEVVGADEDMGVEVQTTWDDDNETDTVSIKVEFEEAV